MSIDIKLYCEECGDACKVEDTICRKCYDKVLDDLYDAEENCKDLQDKLDRADIRIEELEDK